LTKSYKLFNSASEIQNAIPLGSKKMVRIGEKRVCIINHESGFKVFDNLCPHNGHSLLEGEVNYLGEVVCPLHGYRFNLQNGKEGGSRCQDLTIHQIHITNSGVFLRLIM
jgi:nitrite reductase/ring-hydroxylating ferredoxin subunit